MKTIFQEGLGEEIRSVSKVCSNSKWSYKMAAYHGAGGGRTVRRINLLQNKFFSFESLFPDESGNILIEGLAEQRVGTVIVGLVWLAGGIVRPELTRGWKGLETRLILRPLRGVEYIYF